VPYKNPVDNVRWAYTSAKYNKGFDLDSIAEDLGTLGSALTTVESEHLRPLRPAVEAINAQFEGIIGLMPGVAEKAAIVAEHARKQ